MKIKVLLLFIVFFNILFADNDKIADAIKTQNEVKLQKLLQTDANFFKTTKEGYTYLHLAAYYGNLKAMYYLLNFRNFKNILLDKNFIRLNCFSSKKNLDAYIKYLPKSIKNNIIVKKYKYYHVRLPFKNQKDGIKIYNELKKKSLYINIPTKNGNTPIHFLVLNNKNLNRGALFFLKYYKADFCKRNDKGIRPIDIAKKNKKLYEEIIKIFGDCE